MDTSQRTNPPNLQLHTDPHHNGCGTRHGGVAYVARAAQITRAAHATTQPRLSAHSNGRPGGGGGGLVPHAHSKPTLQPIHAAWGLQLMTSRTARGTGGGGCAGGACGRPLCRCGSTGLSLGRPTAGGCSTRTGGRGALGRCVALPCSPRTSTEHTGTRGT